MEDNEIIEFYKNSFRKLYGKLITDEEINEKVSAFLEKNKNIKKMKEAVHIQYFEGTIEEEDFYKYEDKLKNVGLKLSRFDDSGEIKNSLGDFMLMSFAFINEYVFSTLYADIQGDMKWDVIKFLLKSLHEKLNGKKINKIQARKIEEKQLSYGLKVRLDENTQYDFSFTNLDKETFTESLDKVLLFLSIQKKNHTYHLPKFVMYDSREKEWIAIDPMEEIERKLKKK